MKRAILLLAMSQIWAQTPPYQAVPREDENSRIADPDHSQRIFTWLICETRDDRGNAVLYRYKVEDGVGVATDNAHERNRGPQNDAGRTANRYLKRIHYGNRTSLLDNAGRRPRQLTLAQVGTAGRSGCRVVWC